MKDTYYFQHDYNPTADPKMQALIGEFGAIGYGIYWRLVEMMHEAENHKIEHKKYVITAIAKQMSTSVEQVYLIIENCINEYELFESDGECFWSERVLRNINKRTEISEKRSIAGKISSERRKQNSTSVQQNPTKESKGKENKENKENNINIEFDIFWNLYDKKVGEKNKLIKKWENLTDEEREKIIEYIPKYKIAISEKQYRKNPETFMNNKSWNDEIINNGMQQTNITTQSAKQPMTLERSRELFEKY